MAKKLYLLVDMTIDPKLKLDCQLLLRDFAQLKQNFASPRESFHRRDFGGAVEYCYYDDLANGPFNNLMPVGKLRKFDVMFKSELKEDKVRFNVRIQGLTIRYKFK